MAYLSTSSNPDTNAARVLRAQWDRYQKLYTPVENRLIRSIGEDMTRPAMAGAQAADARANQVTDRMQSRMGLASLDGAPVAANRQRTRALSTAEAFNNASLAQVDRDQAIRTGLVDLGQGLVNQATGGLVDSAGMAGQRDMAYRQAQADYSAARSANRNQAISSLASIGTMAAIAF